MHVPIVNEVVGSTLAQTGPPASTRTKLTPTIRKSVLLPAMFEPLTINKLVLGRVVRETACPSGRHSRCTRIAIAAPGVEYVAWRRMDLLTRTRGRTRGELRIAA